MSTKEAMRLAMSWYDSGREDRDEFEEMMRVLLATPQPAQQEPVFWTRKQWGMDREFCEKPFTTDWEPLYTSPPAQRKPLTEEELDAMFSKTLKGKKLVNWVARAIEAAHGIKENT